MSTMPFVEEVSIIHLAALFSLLAFTANAAGPVEIDPVGPHYKLFRFEKTENPQNILIGFTKLTSSCRVELKDGKPLLDFYWLLDGTKYKNPHPLIKKNISKRLELIDRGSRGGSEIDGFTLKLLNDRGFKTTNLKDTTIHVGSHKTAKGCDVTTTATLEPPDGIEKTIRLETIRSETEKTWLPPFRKVISITFEGEDVADGRLVTQVFK